jgi:formylglycine-generating enzyme required for sulfatase activity
MAKKKPNYQTPSILSDLPLKHGQNANFHFDEFAITLARLIAYKKTTTPLTIGISGNWGTGKTTLLRRVKEMLDATSGMKGGTKPDDLKFVTENEFAADAFRTCKTVWFDAWKYAGEDEILAALLRVIVVEMQRGKFWEKVIAELKKPKDEKIKWLGVLLNALTTFTSAGTYGLNLNDYMVETPLKKASAFFDYFDDSFNRLLASWLSGTIIDKNEIDETNAILVVFIDDLDRCLPEKIIQVLEAVKLFLDKTGCVFVLGAHTDVIREAVKKHYTDAGLVEQDAADYLDKFIQLHFELPTAPEDEMEAFVRQLASDGTLATHWKLVTTGAGYNPRKVKVFLNDMSLRWAIWGNVWKTVRVDFDDFVRWEVLMRAAPLFNKRIRGIYDPAQPDTISRLLMAAFTWAGGDENAAVSFKSDTTEQMKRVLVELKPFQEHFTSDVLKSLLLLSAPPQKPVEKVMPAEKPEREGITGALDVTLESMGIKSEERVGTPSVRESFSIGGIEFIKIPAGKFIMGSKGDNSLAYTNEKPQHTLELPEYWMAKFPVMNEQYAAYVGEGKHPVGDWKKKKNHPVVIVSWNDAMAYCKWFNATYAEDLKKRAITLHLPTEAQWEKAARGEYGNEWPWGNEFDPAKCNSAESKKGGTTPVDAYPQGESPYGVADMIGNVWEWTHTLFQEYPYKADKSREDEKASGSRVVRGGSFGRDRQYARCASRNDIPVSLLSDDLGFRVAASPSSPVK